MDVHRKCLHLDHGVRFLDRNFDRYTAQVCIFDLLDPVLQEPVHSRPLDWHPPGLLRDSHIHGDIAKCCCRAFTKIEKGKSEMNHWSFFGLIRFKFYVFVWLFSAPRDLFQQIRD